MCKNSVIYNKLLTLYNNAPAHKVNIGLQFVGLTKLMFGIFRV